MLALPAMPVDDLPCQLLTARSSARRFLYFLDDDNALKPHALRTLLGAALASGAHVLTSANEKWDSLEPPPSFGREQARGGPNGRWAPDPASTERWLPVGASATVGMFRNCYGDASALVARAAFEGLGGFTEDAGVGHEDWELWARATLHGYKLQVVPEALYWYRIAAGRGGGAGMLAESIGDSRLAQAQRQANHARSLRPYLQRLAGWPEAQEAVQLAQGLYLEGA